MARAGSNSSCAKNQLVASDQARRGALLYIALDPHQKALVDRLTAQDKPIDSPRISLELCLTWILPWTLTTEPTGMSEGAASCLPLVWPSGLS
jgi:hypothetical protein